MNKTSRTITGILAVLIGVSLLIAGLFEPFAFIYGIPITIIGFYIFFNKKEDEIEQIKKR
jgi:hypothetical protein